MTVDDLLSHLDAVRRQGRGWVARCPAHQPDRHPSLSVSEGERGILVKCWAGCTAKEIVGALGLTVRELFYDADTPADPRARRAAAQRRERARQRRETEAIADGTLIDARREAEQLIRSARDIDTSGWSDAQLAAALDALADAYTILEREQREEDYVHE